MLPFPARLARSLALACAPLLVAATPGHGIVTVEVTGVRNARGNIHVDLCRQAEFLHDCAFAMEVPANPGTTVVALSNVPAGSYAVQATHDENGNHRVDRGLFGIPKEGIGFSRDAKIVFGPPKWADAAFVFDGHVGHVALRMRYFGGSR